MENLKAVLQDEHIPVNMDLAALEVARIEIPSLEPGTFLEILDSHAVELAGLLPAHADGADFVERANEYLFDDLGFQGNQADYYDPLNSCLNEVLLRRKGIPITLSIVYMEIARRLAKPVYGIALPGHYVVQYQDEDYSFYIDVFNGGRLLESEECLAFASKISGVDLRKNSTLLLPASPRVTLVRLLNNLRHIYLRRREYEKVCEVLDLLILAAPDTADEYAQRGLVNLELKRYEAARKDFETYLRLSPHSSDRVAVEKQLRAISQIAGQR